MNNLVILPILIPLLTGIILIFLSKNINLSRVVSGISMLATIVVSGLIVQTVLTNGIISLAVGSWRAPFGIVLVADMFAALLVFTASIVSLACLLFSFKSIDTEYGNYYYYSLFQFLITGVFGAFLTGDIFNLFVFFEVLLIASYCLLVLGGRKIQFRETIKYILVNIISSALFVIAVAYLYSVTGTLNMAHLSERVAEVGQGNVLTLISVLFLIVFGLKGALFPLFFWLPGSYYAPPTVVTALFGALLSKVGIYAIARTFTLIFYHEPGFTHTLIAVLSGITIVFGVLGAVAYADIRKIVIYNIITAVGVILFGFATLSPDSVSGSIFYLIHDMVIKAALFLLAGATIVITGTSKIKNMGGIIKNHPLLSWIFFIAAIALVGVPPLSGFIGKMLIIRGGFDAGMFAISWIVLLSSLLVLYSMMKIFMGVYLGEARLSESEEKGSTKGLLYPSIMLVIVSVGLGFGSELVIPYVDHATETLLDPAIYIQSVLKE